MIYVTIGDEAGIVFPHPLHQRRSLRLACLKLTSRRPWRSAHLRHTTPLKRPPRLSILVWLHSPSRRTPTMPPAYDDALQPSRPHQPRSSSPRPDQSLCPLSLLFAAVSLIAGLSSLVDTASASLPRLAASSRRRRPDRRRYRRPTTWSGRVAFRCPFARSGRRCL
jgi:hypothetical protein